MIRPAQVRSLRPGRDHVRRRSQDDVDWNTYVEGTWAFLKGDRAMLAGAVKRLSANAKVDDMPNLEALQDLLACFGRDYRTAYLERACAKFRTGRQRTAASR